MMDLYLMIGIKKIDCCSMGVAEVAEKARYYRRRHHMFMAVLIVLLVPVLGSVAVALSDDMAYIWGYGCGGNGGTCPWHWHISENNEGIPHSLWC